MAITPPVFVRHIIAGHLSSPGRVVPDVGDASGSRWCPESLYSFLTFSHGHFRLDRFDRLYPIAHRTLLRTVAALDEKLKRLQNVLGSLTVVESNNSIGVSETRLGTLFPCSFVLQVRLVGGAAPG